LLLFFDYRYLLINRQCWHIFALDISNTVTAIVAEGLSFSVWVVSDMLPKTASVIKTDSYRDRLHWFCAREWVTFKLRMCTRHFIDSVHLICKTCFFRCSVSSFCGLHHDRASFRALDFSPELRRAFAAAGQSSYNSHAHIW